jgi:soluble lytic murein transglycosylase-like protein
MLSQGVSETHQIARLPAGPWARLAALGAAVAMVVALLAGLAASGDSGAPPVSLSGAPLEGDPFEYEPDRRGEFEARAAAGLAHVLYANSPGGVDGTARLVARYREEIERAAAPAGIDPDVLEAIVFLESAGRSQVIAGGDPEGAAGLVQIVASTGSDLLGMKVDLERSRELTRKINRAYELGKLEHARRLTAERARVDERFDPEASLDGAVRYLEIARNRFGADDLALVSYHMGIGNLEQVISTYVSEEPEASDELSYAELYFNSSPIDHPETWDLLASFGDESSEYYWKVRAAEGIMRLYRDEPAELGALARLHHGRATGEEVFHPPQSTEAFADPEELEDAWRASRIVPIPETPELGYVVDPGVAGLAGELGADPALYRGLRPEAVATLVYLAGRVREINGGSNLVVASAVRDGAYQELADDDHEAADGYSLHTTGWSFDIARDYESDAQAGAFQFVLDRLQALALIDYSVEPDVIHVTASNEVDPLLSGGS